MTSNGNSDSAPIGEAQVPFEQPQQMYPEISPMNGQRQTGQLGQLGPGEMSGQPQPGQQLLQPGLQHGMMSQLMTGQQGEPLTAGMLGSPGGPGGQPMQQQQQQQQQLYPGMMMGGRPLMNGQGQGGQPGQQPGQQGQPPMMGTPSSPGGILGQPQLGLQLPPLGMQGMTMQHMYNRSMAAMHGTQMPQGLSVAGSPASSDQHMYNRSLAAMLAGQQRRPRSPMDPHGQIFGVPPPGQPGGHGGQSMQQMFRGGPPPLGGTPVPPPGQNPPPGSMADTSIANTIFTNDFINSVASSLEDFGPELFRQDADISFERDFGQWFNPDDSMGLDMKGSTLPAQQPPPLVELPQHPFQQPPAPGMQAKALQDMYFKTLAVMEGLSVTELPASSDSSSFDLSVPRAPKHSGEESNLNKRLIGGIMTTPSAGIPTPIHNHSGIWQDLPERVGPSPMMGNHMSGMVPGNMNNMEDVNQEIMVIPQNVLAGLRQETGVGDKEISSLSTAEKQRIVQLWRQRRGPHSR